MSSSIGDFLTTLRNSTTAGHPIVDVRKSRANMNVCAAMKRLGLIWDFSPVQIDGSDGIRIQFKHDSLGRNVIREIVQKSTPGRRDYRSYRQLSSVRQGFGSCLLNTNKGVLSGDEARSLRIGGEYICEVW